TKAARKWALIVSARNASQCAVSSPNPCVESSSRTASAKAPPPGTSSTESVPCAASQRRRRGPRSGRSHRLPPTLTTKSDVFSATLITSFCRQDSQGMRWSSFGSRWTQSRAQRNDLNRRQREVKPHTFSRDEFAGARSEDHVRYFWHSF